MLEDINFTIATTSDSEDILDMMDAFNAIDGYPFDRTTRSENLHEFLQNDQLGRLWMIRHQDQVIGYVVIAFGFSFEYGGRDAFIDELFISDDFRNKGIGKKTMDHIAAQAPKLGVNAIHLEVEGHNTNASRLYLSKGYQGNHRMLLTKVTASKKDHKQSGPQS